MEKPKSKVISIRVSDEHIIDFYEANKELCKEEIISALSQISVLAGSKSEHSLGNGLTKDSDDRVLKSLADFHAEVDSLVQSDDFENRMNESNEISQRIEKSIDKIASNSVSTAHINAVAEGLVQSVRASIFIATSLVTIVILVASFYRG